MNKPISTQQTPANIARVMAMLAESPARLERMSMGRSEEELRRPNAPGERSFAEILTHLINTEARNSEAIVSALLADEPLLADIRAERQFGRLMRHDLMPFAENLAYFSYRRAVLLRVLSSLTEKQWGRAIREAGKQRRESVYWRARGMALHEAEHLGELDTRYEIRDTSSERV